MRKLLSRKTVLEDLTKLGLSLKAQTSPSYWSYEDRARAPEFIPQLEATRTAYAQIRRGDDMQKVLSVLKRKVQGIPSNHINLLIIAVTTGFAEDQNWVIKNDKLVFRFRK